MPFILPVAPGAAVAPYVLTPRPRRNSSATQTGRNSVGRALGEMRERSQVRQRLVVLDPPRPLPADRRAEPELKQGVEGAVRVLQNAAEDPVEFRRVDRGQRDPS